MALTKHIKNNTLFRQEFTKCVNLNIYQTVFKNYNLSQYQKKVENITKHYSLIGMAVDYMLRFRISEHLNVDKEEFLNNTMAFKIIELINCNVLLYEHFLEASLCFYKNELEKAFLMFSEIEIYGRSGEIYLNCFNEDTIVELKLFEPIYQSFIDNHLKSTQQILLNPSFLNSIKIGGADSDLIIGDTLIDIKNTKDIKISRDYILQLLGYYVLATLDNIKIDNVALYFSRYDVMVKFKVDTLINSKTNLMNVFYNFFKFEKTNNETPLLYEKHESLLNTIFIEDFINIPLKKEQKKEIDIKLKGIKLLKPKRKPKGIYALLNLTKKML